MLIVSAHRGYPHWVNSGADFIEIDVRRDSRGVIIDSHDEPQPGRNHPTFDEILEAAAGRIGLHLDMKEAGYERELVGRALERFPSDKIVATPDFEESIRAIKRNFPQVRVSPIDFVALDQQYATEKALSSYRIPIWVWTVDDEKQMERLVQDKRIEGLITNRPDLALELRSARS
jgi:glycerophosphoryl diester phosphodiesterase